MKTLNKIRLSVVMLCLALSGNSFADSSYDLYLKSNQKFLEDTIGDLALVDAVKQVIPKSSSLVLRNIEEEGTTDKKIVALIEDQLISKLVSNGYQVLERDENAIRRTLEEKSAGKYFSLINKVISPEMPKSDIKVNTDLKGGSSKIQLQNVSIDDGSKHMVRTHLQGAAFIINYRVQELGINYTQEIGLSEVASKMQEVTNRSAIIRMHVRIEKADTGRILLAENITNTKTDSLSKEMMKQLSNYKYSQFYNGYPTNNSDENNIYTYTIRRGYVEYGLFSMHSASSRTIVGLKSGKQRIGFEITSFSKDFGGAAGVLANDFQMLIVNNEVGKIDTSFGNFSVVSEYGLGSGNMQLKTKASSGTVIKAGIAMETDLIGNISGKVGLDVYAGEAGGIENIFGSITYNFN